MSAFLRPDRACKVVPAVLDGEIRPLALEDVRAVPIVDPMLALLGIDQALLDSITPVWGMGDPVGYE